MSVAGVVQEPESGYNLTAGGNSITFTAAPTTGENIFVIFLGIARDVGQFLNSGIITSQTELAEQRADGDFLLIYDTSAAALRKIQASNVAPTLTHVSRTGTGDGSTTTFTVTSGVAVANVLVFVNGVVQRPTTDYTISGTTLTFGTAPAASDRVDIRELPR